jgi:uncharacterized membrane protein YhhN
MSYSLWFVFGIAFLDWVAVVKKWKWLRLIAKPGVMLALLIWLLSLGGYQGQLIWFTLALFFSLAGDIFLILPQQIFLLALLAFLLAHLAYLIGFSLTLPPINLVSLILVLLVGVTTAQIYRRVSVGLSARGETRLQKPILIYSILISLMLISALMTLVRPDSEWRSFPALLVSLGALLFYISDSLLALNRFVKPLPSGDLKVIVTYHLGQIAIILGVALNFLQID